MNSAVMGTSLVAHTFFPRRIFSEESTKTHRLVYRQLGSTGFKVTEIGFGAMNTRDSELIEAAIDAGINYIDTAHGYMNGENEEIIGKIMKRKRDKVFLTTKVSWANPEKMPSMIEKSLQRLQTDHVDLLLLHGADKSEPVLNDLFMKVFDTARQKGYTRFVGYSTHNFNTDILNATLKTKFWEAVLVGYNYFSPPVISESIQKAREAGIAIIGMKNILNVQTPDSFKTKIGKFTHQQALLKWVLENSYIDTVIPGMTSFEHLSDDLAVMSMDMSFRSSIDLQRYGNYLENRYCRGVAGCTGCLDKCPKGVKISDINRCLGYAFGYHNLELAYENYRELPRSHRVDICSNCDECAVKCINGINLTENIKNARQLFS
jgi:predicted aldo/keto reductase-like oxidoreductase